MQQQLRRAGSHPWVAATVVLLLAVGVRIAVYTELRDTPPLHDHELPEMDTAFFDAWARRIAAGDWLTDAELHPQHSWHRSLAARVLELDPERLQRDEPDRPPPRSQGEASTRLWNHWYGGKRFHQEPLYPYALAVLYGPFGGDAQTAYRLQPLLGIAGVLLVQALTGLAFGPRAGFVAGVLAALRAPWVFYDFVLLRATSIASAGVGLAWALERLRRRPSTTGWLGLGVALGLATALKLSLLALGMLGLAWVLAARTDRLRPALAVLAGFALALAPWIARNAALGAPLLGLSSVGPITFLVANHPLFLEHLGWNVRPEVADLMLRTDGSLLGAVVTGLSAHDGPLAYAGFAWTKFVRVWHWFEVHNNVNFYFAERFSTVLAALPVRFGWIAPLGVLGGALALRRRRGMLPGLLAATSLLPLVGFYHLSRFRLPLLVALLPFAALALVELWDLARSRRALPLLAATALLAGAIAWVQRPIDPPTPLIRYERYQDAFARHVAGEVQRARSGANEARAAHLLEEFLERRPAFVAAIDEAHPPGSRDGVGWALLVATLRDELATSLERLGRSAEAQSQRRRAAALRNAAHAAARELGIELG